MGARTTKSLVNLAGGKTVFAVIIIGVVLWLLHLGVHSTMHEAAIQDNRPAAANTNGSYSRLICNNAYETEKHYEKQNLPYIDIPLSAGCYSGFIVLPDQWDSWQTQFLGNDPSDWVAEWPAQTASPVGPYSAAQINSETFSLIVPMKRLRLQGKGTLRLYRITSH